MLEKIRQRLVSMETVWWGLIFYFVASGLCFGVMWVVVLLDGKVVGADALILFLFTLFIWLLFGLLMFNAVLSMRRYMAAVERRQGIAKRIRALQKAAGNLNAD